MNGRNPEWPCLRAAHDGAVLDVSVVAGAARTEPVGLHDGALRVRLAAPPVDGKANEALLAWLADELGCARRHVVLQRGHASRRKQVAIDVPAAHVAQWLARRLPRV
jgi:uncharacterized protein (TIGR00251 family)